MEFTIFQLILCLLVIGTSALVGGIGFGKRELGKLEIMVCQQCTIIQLLRTAKFTLGLFTQ